ncbi:MAG: DUF7575 domain-containing protein [Promethearchaeota archaeon]
MVQIQIDPNWETRIKNIMKEFLNSVSVLDPAGARKEIMELISIIRRKDEIKDVKLVKDARVALETIQQVDHAHPEKVLIDSRTWQGNLSQVKKNVTNYISTRDFDKVEKLVPLLIYTIENNQDIAIRRQAASILLYLAKQHSMVLESYISRFFRLIFEDDPELTEHVAGILYNIDFQSFTTQNPKKLRKLLQERFEENLVNIWADRDYFRHFIRYKLNIENFTRQWIWDVELKIKKSPGFKIVKIEPKYPFVEKALDNAYTIDLNVVEHRSTKQLTVFIEPLAKPVISIKMNIFFKNNEGRLLNREIPEEDIDLSALVPSFKKNIPITLNQSKQFFDYKAKHKDNRIFDIPGSISLHKLNTMLIKIVEEMGLMKVHAQESENIATLEEYFAETYFHGITKVRGDHMVIVARISGEGRYLTLLIAANQWVYVMGMFNKILMTLNSLLKEDHISELKCPSCLEPIERDLDFCPWCGFKFKKQLN